LYAELHLFVTKVIGREPHQIRYLTKFVRNFSRNKRLHPNIRKWINHLYRRSQASKPQYHDLTNFVRIAVGIKKVTNIQIQQFVYRIVRPANAGKGKHSQFWKRYGGLKQSYVSGLKNNAKFMLFNSQNLHVVGTRLREFKTIDNKNYFFFDESTNTIRWLGDARKSLGVIDLRAGSRIQLVDTNGKQARRKDWFFYDMADMKFHNYVKRDLCISFKNPGKAGAFMELANCNCHGAVSSRQELFVKYFEFDNNNGFVPMRKFYFKSASGFTANVLRVSNDGSYLQSSQRYVKVQKGEKIGDDALFYWDPKSKCLRNVRYGSCMGYTMQGDSFQFIALGETEPVGTSLTNIKYDVSFIWLNDRVVQPQAGYTNVHGMTVSLNSLTGKKYQHWNIMNTNSFARSAQAPRRVAANNKRNNAWQEGVYFNINVNNGNQLTVSRNGRVTVARPNRGNRNHQFYVDENSKVIRNLGTGLALSAEQRKGKMVLIARRPTRTASEYFSRPSKAGVVQMSANKDYVWKLNVGRNTIEIVKGDGSHNWSTTGTYFKQSNVSKRNGAPAKADKYLAQESEENMILNESE
jgi:hypothetical protein